MLEKLACKLERNDEIPNIELAEDLCQRNDTVGIKEVVDGVLGADKAVANDCIKVLYEIGSRRPELISGYVQDFLSLLLSKNNRLAWGSMMALAEIADLKADEIFSRLSVVMSAYESGSVITRDNSMTVFAKVSRANKEYEREIFPFLIGHLTTCRPKEVPQHAERIAVCVNRDNAQVFSETLKKRIPHLADTGVKRIEKLLKPIM